MCGLSGGIHTARSTARHCAAASCAVLRGTAQYCAVPRIAAQYCAVLRSTAQCRAVLRSTASQQIYVYIRKLSKVNTKMADEDEYCDLAVAYWYFLRNSVNTKKRKQGKKRQVHVY